jgi:hypothetical protein
MSAIKPKKDKKTKAKETKTKKTKIEIKTSGDFENDPEGAMDALDQSGFLVFMVTENGIVMFELKRNGVLLKTWINQ